MGKQFETISDLTGIKNSILAGFSNLKSAPLLSKGNDDELQKSHIINAFNYGDDKLKITKTGKEIKEKLGPQLAEETAEAAVHKSNMEKYEKEVGVAPDQDMDSYEYREMSIGEKPKRYSWNMTDWYEPKQSQMSSMVAMPEYKSSTEKRPEKAESEQQAKAARDYNNCCRKYVDAKAEIAFIEMMQRNLNDGTSYSLNTKQAVALGF